MNVLIFKNVFVDRLKDSVVSTLHNYASDEPWVDEVGNTRSRDISTSVTVSQPIRLELPENGDLKDTENAVRLHKALRQLTLLQARDPRLWARLSHYECWLYMRSRWPVEKYMDDQDKAARFIKSRYFVAQNQSRSLLRNGIARLWWSAHLAHDDERDNPYELTPILFSYLDITQQILERGIGRAKNVTIGFLDFLNRNSEILLTGGNRNRQRIRRLAKYLNMHGGIAVLDCLSRTEIVDILTSEFAIILKSESNNTQAEQTSGG